MDLMEEILKIINQKGLNVLEFARKTGISSDKIYKWRRGEGKPKYEDAQILAKYLNLKLEETPKPEPEHENKSLSLTDQLIKVMIGVMERQNEILRENKEVYLEKVNTISIHIEAIKKNHETLTIELQARSNDLTGKIEVFERTVTEKLDSIHQSLGKIVMDEDSRPVLHEFVKKGNPATPAGKGKQRKVKE